MTQPASSAVHARFAECTLLKEKTEAEHLNTISRDLNLATEIKIFIRKVEILSQVLGKNSYKEKLSSLTDPSLSLEEFKRQLVSKIGVEKAKKYSFFSQSVFEFPEFIVRIFTKYNIRDAASLTPFTPLIEEKLAALLRKICVEGKIEDLKQLLGNVKINVNTVEKESETHRTALHWLVIGANNLANTNQLSGKLRQDYQYCYELLLSYGADVMCKDRVGSRERTVLEYDEKKLFSGIELGYRPMAFSR